MPAIIVAIPDPRKDIMVGPKARPLFFARNQYGDGWSSRLDAATCFGSEKLANPVLERLLRKDDNTQLSGSAPSKLYPKRLIGLLLYGEKPSPAIHFPNPKKKLHYNPENECFLSGEPLPEVVAGDRINPIFVQQKSKQNPGQTYFLQLRLSLKCKKFLNG